MLDVSLALRLILGLGLGSELGLGLCTVGHFYCSVAPVNMQQQPCCFYLQIKDSKVQDYLLTNMHGCFMLQ